MNILEKLRCQGFRKWASIPEEVIVKKYGEEKIAAMVVEDAIDHMFREAMAQEKLIPVAQAELSEIISQNPISKNESRSISWYRNKRWI